MPRRGLWTLRALAIAVALASGCTVEDLDLVGKACPCPSDLACDDASNTCVPRGGPSSGSGASSSSSGTGGASSCAGVCGTPGCGTCPDAPVVAIDAYDIDATEVTIARYQAFLDVSPDVANQGPLCLWNESFAAATGRPDDGCDVPPDLAQYPNHPISCIDWCDAQAYCTWAKRRLCGRIGPGSLPQEQAGDPALSEWHRACTKAGTRAFPYGDVFDETRCNTLGSPYSGTLIDVGSAPDCVGGYDGLFDMSGNLEEWEDACGVGPDADDPADDGCPLRGGAYWTGETDARCDGLAYAAHRDTPNHDWGFRCCGPPE